MKIEIDETSGFCFGVTTAIQKAEEKLREGGVLYCLGDIVHNGMEMARLKRQGLQTIDHGDLLSLEHARLLLRAHGEPPQTYQTARRRNLQIIDATCPVVLALQRRIKQQYDQHPSAQIVIFGKKGHAEVLGLVGQTHQQAIVVEKIDDLGKLDFSKDIYLYSQTTMSLDEYKRIIEYCEENISPDARFQSFDTICRQVANRIKNIKTFASKHALILFVAGRKSSNGKVLFNQCLEVNANCHQIESADEIDPLWLENVSSVGICGATSTPKWLMEQCMNRVITNHKQQ